MPTKTTLLVLAVSLTGLLGLAACDRPAQTDDDGYSAWAASDDEDTPDCDAEDRRHQEVPDCGFISGGRFYWWSWAAQNYTTAPRGWRPGAEQRAVTKPKKAPATKVTTAPARPAATTPARQVAPPRSTTRTTKRVVVRNTKRR